MFERHVPSHMIIKNFKLLNDAEQNGYLLVSLDVVYLHYIVYVSIRSQCLLK